jgi:CRP/FNR family transcriptional regulator, cyclic AMP receptor protein
VALPTARPARPARPNVLHPRSFLDALPEVGRDRVLTVAARHTYTRGEVLVHQGDAADSLFVVESGSLAVRLSSPLGDSVMLTVMGAGDVFGEVGMLVDQERTATVVAINDVVARMLRREDFERLRREHPEVTDFLLTLLARRTERLSRLVAQAHHMPVDQRVARRLLEAGRHFSSGVVPVVVPLTQDDLAQLAGSTRPTTNHILKRFEADGVIRLARGRVEILDVAGLREHC